MITRAALALGLLVGCAPHPSHPSQPTQPTVMREPSTVATSDARPAPDPELHVAELGRCVLESGAVIEECRVGYRTFGTLDAAASNAILVPSWFTGTSQDLAALLPGRFVDVQRYFLILVDAFADGVSSSPSNSRAHPRLHFPRFSVRDLVESQRRLLEETLGIHHLHAVLGISMGGMQAIEWSVTHPDFMGRVVAMAGTPQLTSQDLLLWTAELHAIENDTAYRGGAYAGHPALRTAVDLLELTLVTPAYRAAHTTRGELPAWLTQQENSARLDWNDRRRQVEAMLAHDVAAPYGGSLEAAAARIHAQSLYLVSAQDQVVSPLPAARFGALAHATVDVSQSDCGHLAVQVCETATAAAKVTAFLAP